MELIRGLHNIKPKHRGCVLTIGNFDGVHLGHQAVLSQLKQSAHQSGLPAVVMVFEPQPLELFNPAAAPARLSRFREKYHWLARLGLNIRCRVSALAVLLPIRNHNDLLNSCYCNSWAYNT